MRLPALLLVAGVVGWGVQAHAGAPEDAAGTAEASGKPAKDNPTIASRAHDKQTAAKFARNRIAKAVHDKQTTDEDICRAVAQAAADNELPVDFFARVIWQESRFNARAVSPKGAEGIAQFTPQTAVFRGLVNPFDPISSLKNAARYLGDLRKRFGNLGLAAAGYNAGPGRVREWLDGKGALPRETRNYVTITTGSPADKWASPSPPRADGTIPQGFPCASLARIVLAPLKQAGRIAACVPPWGTHLTANWLKARGWAASRTPQQRLATLVGDRGRSMLRMRFGNLGLAAACSNADPAWVHEWRAAKGALIATGWRTDEWASRSPLTAQTAASQGVVFARAAHLVVAQPMEVQHGDRGRSMLRKRLGNLGLAVACSNADPAWVHAWRAAKGALMATGWSTDEWASRSPLKAETAASQAVSFARTAHLVVARPMEVQHAAGHVPRWGAQLTANWSQERAWATYREVHKRFAALIGDREPIMLHGTFPGLGATPRYMVRIADDSREDLEELCNKLIAAGGACAVLRNQEDQGTQPAAFTVPAAP